MRLLPTEWFTFRPQEALGRFPIAEGPYFPLRRVRMTHTYGDLANLGNLPALRQYHAQTASSDELGYRNPPGFHESGGMDVVLVGDSFSLGTGLSDWETLPAQIAVQGGLRVYSVATQSQLPTVAQILSMATRIRMTRGIVLLQLLERKDTPSASEILAQPAPASLIGNSRKWLSLVGSDVFHYSPLKILASRWQRSLQDDRILPNPSRTAIAAAQLRNGQLMLFHRDELKRQAPLVDVSPLRVLQHELSAHHLTLATLLVPNKYTVYRPLLASGTPATSEEAFLRLETSLREAGIPVVQPLPSLREAARTALADRRYIYWLDDTHWNREGVKVAAEEVVETVAPLIRRPGAPKEQSPADLSAGLQSTRFSYLTRRLRQTMR